MATLDSVDAAREALDGAWEALAAAIDAAASVWDERILESEDPSADAWSPRLAAWHAIAGERIRTAYVEHLVAERPPAPDDMMAFAASDAAGTSSIGALREAFRTTRTPGEMQTALQAARVQEAKLLQRLTEGDLAVSAQLVEFVENYIRERGETPTQDVRGILTHGVAHMRDHARQLSTTVARG